MHRPAPLSLSILAVLALGLLAGCGSDHSNPVGQGSLLPPDSAQPGATDGPAAGPNGAGFVTEITNPYLAFTPGKIFRYHGESKDGVEDVVVEVTHDVKTIMGIQTTVVHEQTSIDGDLVEDTFDWYAQSSPGGVVYFGEATQQLSHGSVIGTEGSWEAGAEAALPGVVMMARPEIGIEYEQEHAPGVALDQARVLSLTETVTVPYGTFTNCLETEEWTPLEPGVKEYKYYAPGTGLVLEIDADGNRLELTNIE